VTRSVDASEIPWDLSRLPVSGEDIRSTGQARPILDDIQQNRTTVERVVEFVEGERPGQRVRPTDWARTLDYGGGELVVLTWSSFGYSYFGYLPNAGRFDAFSFSALYEQIGQDSEEYRRVAKGTVSETLEQARPCLLHRTEVDEMPPLQKADDGAAEEAVEMETVQGSEQA